MDLNLGQLGVGTRQEKTGAGAYFWEFGRRQELDMLGHSFSAGSCWKQMRDTTTWPPARVSSSPVAQRRERDSNADLQDMCGTGLQCWKMGVSVKQRWFSPFCTSTWCYLWLRCPWRAFAGFERWPQRTDLAGAGGYSLLFLQSSPVAVQHTLDCWTGQANSGSLQIISIIYIYIYLYNI